MSTPFYLPCDSCPTFSYPKCGRLSHNYRYGHLWCSASYLAKCRRFVTWFLDTFVMTNQMSSEMWTFCQTIFGYICDVQLAIELKVDILSHDFCKHLWWPIIWQGKCRRFVMWFLDTFVMTSQMSSEMWTFCQTIFGYICDVQLAIELKVDILSHDFCKHLWWPIIWQGKCGCFVTWFFGHFCDVKPAVKRSTEIFLFWIPVRECARTLWIGAPFWRERDRVPQAGRISVSWAQTGEVERRDRTKWGDGRKSRKTTPSWLQNASMHRVSSRA